MSEAQGSGAAGSADGAAGESDGTAGDAALRGPYFALNELAITRDMSGHVIDFGFRMAGDRKSVV